MNTLDQDQQDQLYKFLQPPGAGLLAPSAQPSSIAAPSTAPAGGGTPPAPPPDIKNIENDNDPANKIADSHPGLQPNALDKYIGGQENQVDKFGPDQQKAVLDMIQNQQNSLGSRIGRAGTGFADAIMQGVARAGPSNFQKNFQENQESQLNRQAAAIPQLQEMNAKNMAAKQALESQSPNTPLGSSNLPMLQAVGSMYGMKPEQLKALEKSNPQAAMKLMDQVGQFAGAKMKAQIEQEMKMLQIQVENQRNSIDQQRVTTEGNLGQQQKNIEQQRVGQEALKETAQHPILHPINAWQANQEIARRAGAGGPQSPSFASEQDAEKANLPPGTVVTIAGRRARVK